MKKFWKISAFSLKIFVGISNSWHGFLWSRLLISWRIFSLSTISTEKKTLLIAFILSRLRFLTIAFRIGFEIIPEMPSKSWYLGTLRLITMLEKKGFFMLAVSLSVSGQLAPEERVRLKVRVSFRVGGQPDDYPRGKLPPG